MCTNTRKRVALVVLGLIVASSTLVAQQYSFKVGQLYYKITDATKREVAVVPENSSSPYYYYNKPTGAIDIPTTVVNGGNTYSVTSIGDWVFYGCHGLTSINIPNSVTSIGNWAFYGCSGLTSINIPNSITSIGGCAFAGCSGLTSINIPNSVTSIGGWAFHNCSGLTSITIPNSVTSIGEWVFAGCSGLTSITIPNSVTSIGEGTFSICSGLTSITIPNSVTSIGKSAFSRCSGLTSITIPNSVTSIGEWVFAGCSGLTSITIPNSVTSIGDSAFSRCSELRYVTFPGYISFKDNFDISSNIDTVVIASGSDSICNSSFLNCSKIKYISIPSSVTSIGQSAFSGCSGLTSITIPNSVTSIGYVAFAGCTGLRHATIPGYINFKDNFDISSNIDTVVIASGSDSICNSSFLNCSKIKYISIPSSVTSIGQSAFSGCSGLTSINIPNGVTSIVYGAFAGCRGLTAVAVGWQTPLVIDQSVFSGVTLNSVKLIVPTGKKSVYKTAPVWKDFNPIVEPSYTIVYNISVNGTFTVKDGSQEVASGSTVDHGTVLTIEARAAEHYKLDSILVNGTRISGLSFTVTDNTNIEVFFGKQSYAVTYNSNMYSGKIEVTRGSEIVASGSSVEYGTQLMVRAIPNHGFEVKSLTINDQAIVNNFVFSISESVEIKAVFAPATTALDEATTEPLAIYPNPVAEVLYLSATARTIRIYDMYGTEVAHATDTDRIDVANLPAGVYTVKADSTVAKMVKR